MATLHRLERIAPTWGSPLGPGIFGINNKYLVSCFCGWKAEKESKRKAMEAFEVHQQENQQP